MLQEWADMIDAWVAEVGETTVAELVDQARTEVSAGRATTLTESRTCAPTQRTVHARPCDLACVPNQRR